MTMGTPRVLCIIDLWNASAAQSSVANGCFELKVCSAKLCYNCCCALAWKLCNQICVQ